MALLNALFPGLTVYLHEADGNNTSDTGACRDWIYDADTMTLERQNHYISYSGDGPNGCKRWKERFALKAPKMEYVQSLIDCSMADGNGELTALLLELTKKLRDGLITYEDDGSDTRVIGEKYDVEKEGRVDGYEGEYVDEDDDEYNDEYDDEYDDVNDEEDC